MCMVSMFSVSVHSTHFVCNPPFALKPSLSMKRVPILIAPFMSVDPLGRSRSLILLACLLMLVVGCRRHASHSHEHPGHDHHDHHGHSHGGVVASDPLSLNEAYTVWSHPFEVFTEHTRFVQRQEGRVVVHLSELDTGKPYAQDGLTLAFHLDERKVAIPLSTNLSGKEGIFIGDLYFPIAGTWKQSLLGVPGTSDNQILLPDIVVHEPDQVPNTAAWTEPKDMDKGDGDEIVMTKEQQWKVGLRADAVGRRSLAARVALPARIEARPGGRRVLRATVTGELMEGPNGFPNPGDNIQLGQVLARLRLVLLDDAVRFGEVDSGWTRASAALEQATRERDRVRRLQELEARSERELLEAETAWKTARAVEQAARATRDTLRSGSGKGEDGAWLTDVISTGAGTLETVHVGPGDVIAFESPLFTIVDESRVWLRVSVPESIAMQQQDGESDLLLESIGRDPHELNPLRSLKQLGGQLVWAKGAVATETRTVSFLYELPNPELRHRPGRTYVAHLAIAQVQDALAVPVSALLDELGQVVAYVQMDGENFERRELQLGVRDGLWVEVKAGLEEGERVVVRGAHVVRLVSLSHSLPDHGHEH